MTGGNMREVEKSLSQRHREEVTLLKQICLEDYAELMQRKQLRF